MEWWLLTASGRDTHTSWVRDRDREWGWVAVERVKVEGGVVGEVELGAGWGWGVGKASHSALAFPLPVLYVTGGRREKYWEWRREGGGEEEWPW